MRRKLRKLLRTFRLVPPSPLEAGKVWEFGADMFPWKESVCPHCYGREFLMGPEGPGSTNVKCTACGHRWNVMYAIGRWEFIGADDDLRTQVRRARLAKGLAP